MLEAILKLSKSPSDKGVHSSAKIESVEQKKLRTARIESIKQQIISISKYRSNCAAFLLDHYFRRELKDLGGHDEDLYEVLLPVYEQAYLDELEVAEEFRKISGGIYFEMVMNYASAYASEASRIKNKLEQKTKASST